MHEMSLAESIVSLVESHAEAEGFSQRTLYRSREKLGELIVDTEGHKHPENRWALA